MAYAKTKLLFRNRSMELGGVETVLINILNQLDYSKFEVTLLLNYRQGEFLHLVPEVVTLLSIGEGSSAFSSNRSLQFLQKLRRRLKFWSFQKYPQLFYRKNNLLDLDYEVAFSHNLIEDIQNSPNKKSKKIFWIHGDLRKTGYGPQKNKQLVNAMSNFEKGVFVSKFGKRVVEEEWNIKLDQAEVIYNAIDIAKIDVQAEELIGENYQNIDFIGVGRLFWQKGFRDLLEAHNKLICEGYEIKTLILGDGIQRGELEKLVMDYQIQDSFIIHGFASNPVKFIKKARIFVLPSYSESYPMVVAEALCVETPVLSNQVGGVSEMIESGVNGILFESNPETLYQEMKNILDGPEIIGGLSPQSSRLEFERRNLQIHQQINCLFK